jgi:hypothetical protein
MEQQDDPAIPRPFVEVVHPQVGIDVEVVRGEWVVGKTDETLVGRAQYFHDPAV